MYDAIIVGARCAGSSLGLLLARRGYRVLVIDRATFPSNMTMSTHLVHPRGIACLSRWGLRDQVVATESHPIRRCDIDFGSFTLSGCAPPVDGEACSFAPRRILFDEILVRAAVNSGAELREGCRVKSLLVDQGRVSGVKAVTATGTEFAEKSRLVVGADGPASCVAAEVKAREYNQRPPLQGTAWIYWSGVLLEDMELHLREYEGVYAFPSSNRNTLIGANWAIDRFRANLHRIGSCYFDLLRRAAPHLAERIAGTERADERIYFGSTRNFFRKACGPGWVLLGDAHYKKDPCTAQGISDAFCDAEQLAETLDQGLGGKEDLSDALEEYEKARVAWSMPFYELTCEMAAFAPPPPPMQALYAALQGNQEDTNAFIGLVTEAVSPTRFFARDNVERILKDGPIKGKER